MNVAHRTLLYLIVTSVIAGLFIGCQPETNKVRITFLQLNDVYEMAPTNSMAPGGLPRVQTLLKELKAQNPNTYTVLAGDLFSPSAIGTADYDGRPLAGRQMVDLLNKMGWDYFILGNHEFDIPEEDMRERCKEAQFTILTDNVRDKNGQPFSNTVTDQKLEVEGITIGLIGVTMNNFKLKYATISDPIPAAVEMTEKWKAAGAEIIVAFTHQDIHDDDTLAAKAPDIDLIMGGHEHVNFYRKRGTDLTPITKADANAKTAFVHKLTYDKESGQLDIQSELVVIDSSIPSDPEIQRAADQWTQIAFKAFEEKGYQPAKLICNSPVNLDGTEASVRSQSTNLTELITKGFLNAYTDADASLMNGGSVRIDDTLYAGPITQYDIMRLSPFGGDISLVKMTGKTLTKALNQGKQNVGIGAFLQYSGIEYTDGDWKIAGQPIKDSREYTIAITSYLVEFGDTNLDFLRYQPEGEVQKTDAVKKDFYRVVIDQFKKEFPE